MWHRWYQCIICKQTLYMFINIYRSNYCKKKKKKKQTKIKQTNNDVPVIRPAKMMVLIVKWSHYRNSFPLYFRVRFFLIVKHCMIFWNSQRGLIRRFNCTYRIARVQFIEHVWTGYLKCSAQVTKVHTFTLGSLKVTLIRHVKRHL